MTRSKTTSIPRPKEPAKASDEGRSRLGDFTRPIPIEKRIFRRPKLALFGGTFVLLVIGTIAAAVWDGRRYAEELDEPPTDDDEPGFRREVVQLSAEG